MMMMNLRCLFLTLICLQKVRSQETDADAAAAAASATTPTPIKTFRIYHSLAPDAEFTPRGTIEFTLDEGGNMVTSIKQEENCLTDLASSNFQDLIATNGLYRVMVSDEESDSDTKVSVLASASACDIRRSNFREEIGLSLGDTGSLISISYKPIVSPLALPCAELPSLTELMEAGLKEKQEIKFQTKVTYSTASQGMTIPVVMPQNRPPPGYAWIKRLVKRGEAGANAGGNGGSGNAGGGGGGAQPFDPTEVDAKNTEHQSFFRKYWYIILPVTIMTLLGGEEEPDHPNAPPSRTQGGVGGGGGGMNNAAMRSHGVGGGGMAAAAAAGGGAASRGQRQRRGKRG